MDGVEGMVHVIFADNTIPPCESHEISNNTSLLNVPFEVDAFVEEIQDEFGVELPAIIFNSFETVGDVVRWLEALK